MSDKIYLDHNATTPVDPRVIEAMLPFFTATFGNAASNDHDFGLEAKRAVEKAREQLAAAINAHPEEIIFTSGATESNNLAIAGIAIKHQDRGKHLITAVTEHKAVLDCMGHLEKLGFEVTYLPVDGYGRVDPDTVRSAIRPTTILVSIMAANNEIGTLAALEEIGKVTRERNVFFHTDATQALGNIEIDVQGMHIDLLSASAHKVYGPKGVGMLYRRRSNPRVTLEPLLYGGGHEKGLRSGTLNVPGIVGFGEAIAIAKKEWRSDKKKYSRWNHEMLNFFKNHWPGVEVNGHSEERIKHNLNIYLPGIESRALIVRLKNVAIATGSACTSTSVQPSHVITALGFGVERAHSSIRISFGRFNTDEEIETAASRILAAASSLKTLGV